MVRPAVRRVLSGSMGFIVVGRRDRFIRVRPWGCRVRSRSLGAFLCALGEVRFVGVAGFIGVSPVRHRVCSGSMGFIWVRPGGRRFRSSSMGAFGCTLGDVRFVQCGLIQWGAAWWSSGSLGISGFIGKRPGVRSGSLGSLLSALGDVWFVRGRRIHWVAPLWSSGSFAINWVHLDGPWGRRVRPVLQGTLGCALGVAELFRGRRVHLGVPFGKSCSFVVDGFIGVCPGGHQVCSGSMGSLGCALGVVVFVHVGFSRGRLVHWCAHRGTSGSFWVAWFIVKRPGDRRVHSGSLTSLGCAHSRRVQWRSLGSLVCALGDVGIVLGRLVHCCAPWGSSGSFAIAYFIGVRPGSFRDHSE